MSDELNPYPGNLKHHRVDPLLSDEQVMDARAWPPEEVRHYYEAARAKDAELIQRLVDALRNAHKREWGEAGSKSDLFEKEAISLAAAAGYKPSQR